MGLNSPGWNHSVRRAFMFTRNNGEAIHNSSCIHVYG